MLRIRSQTPPELKAVHHRHCQVTQDDIGLTAGDLRQAFAPIGGEDHTEPGLSPRSRRAWSIANRCPLPPDERWGPTESHRRSGPPLQG